MSELAAEHYEIVEGEPPELMGRNLSSAAHLLASATAFFFLAFAFGYFYLRSLDNGGLWRPKGIEPAQAWGAIVIALVVVSAGLTRLGLVDHRAGRRPQWRVKGIAALLLGIAAVVCQVVEWTTLGFGPADGGYASIFFGWTAFQLLFVVGALFWLETIVATSFRYRGAPTPAPGEASGDPGRLGHDIADPLAVNRPGLEAVSFYWTFLAGIAVIAWIVLYLL